MSLQTTEATIKSVSIKYGTLQTFLEAYPELLTPLKCPYTTVSNQINGKTYYLPRDHVNKTYTDHDDDAPKLDIIDEFFSRYEEARRETMHMSTCMSYAERQTYHIPPFVPGEDRDAVELHAEFASASITGNTLDDLLAEIEDDGPTKGDQPSGNKSSTDHMHSGTNGYKADSDDEQPPPDDLESDNESNVTYATSHHPADASGRSTQYYNSPVSKAELERAEFVDKSCLMIDLDCYQPGSERQFTDADYSTLVQEVACVVKDLLVFGGETRIYAAILNKPEVRKTTHKTHGACFKDSLHCNFYVRMSKAVKKYILRQIKTEIVPRIFARLRVCGTHSDMVDEHSAAAPNMLYGSAKRGSSVAHQFHSLYVINLTQTSHNVLQSHEFDTQIIASKSKAKKAEPTIVHPPHNLAFELSLCYECTHGLIKKQFFEVAPGRAQLIKTYNETHDQDLIDEQELYETKQMITDISVRDCNAKNLYEILNILSIHRAEDYNEWMKVITLLARTSNDYKPLAIHFSQRAPKYYERGGLAKLEEIWEWALAQTSDREYSGIATLRAMAKADNPAEYERVTKSSAFNQGRDLIEHWHGDVPSQELAKLIYSMFSDLFVTDTNAYSTSAKTKIWYEFVLPAQHRQYDGKLYKWRAIPEGPDSLTMYIAEKFPKFLQDIRDFMVEQKEGAAEAATGNNDKAVAHYEKIIGALDKKCRKLKEPALHSSLLFWCDKYFRKHGFIESLDQDENAIGLRDAVLVLAPFQVIQSYHEIRITRFCNANYMKYTGRRDKLKNNKLHALKASIKLLFIYDDGRFDKESYRYIMTYMATSLDGHKKIAKFFIWQGGGGNGKSSILDMLIMTMNYVSSNGYGCKLNATYFTEPSRVGGPNSEVASMEKARCIYSSEFPEGANLQMDKIKEITSETITSNDKNEKQKMFLVKANIIVGVNYEPNIAQRDYGCQRRILFYNFKRNFKPKSEFDPNNPTHALENRFWAEQAMHDIEYRSAFMALLCHYYRKYYAERCNYDINRMPHDQIRRETKEYIGRQDSVIRFIDEFVKHRRDIPDSANKIIKCKLDDVVNTYYKWLTQINIRAQRNNDTMKKTFMLTELKKHIVTESNVLYIKDHWLFQPGEAQVLPDNVPCMPTVDPDPSTSDDESNDNIAVPSM